MNKHIVNITNIQKVQDDDQDLAVYPVNIDGVREDFYYLDENGVLWSVRGKTPKAIKLSGYGWFRLAGKQAGEKKFIPNFQLFELVLPKAKAEFLRENWNHQEERLKTIGEVN
ncbi:hypothetical protein K5A21_002862 [Listeria innocua]|uniref:hypothetical protein n=1 Tax=Listeria TaxID=1637 RepID=UPI000F229042|nr:MULTISPECIES: hypothetical protein [Listeria]EAC7992073.1 hypothetical protein [Listeria monocytogenes]EAC8007145.1 hypothetical protein [Listeria monocytogenes]EAD6723866.1 hypothetical protein [Listeria monocytogenes]EAE0719587.1 hypothetical protein [Listeria monocytogenes]EAE3417564.1 hypothetical protein [Listeria monocytogenes]